MTKKIQGEGYVIQSQETGLLYSDAVSPMSSDWTDDPTLAGIYETREDANFVCERLVVNTMDGIEHHTYLTLSNEPYKQYCRPERTVVKKIRIEEV
jgi:hypothetical protein